MVLKILMLNILEHVDTSGSDVIVAHSKIEDAPTLHDFHVLVLDTAEILEPEWWEHNKLGKARARFFPPSLPTR
jgi:hypothetical protein